MARGWLGVGFLVVFLVLGFVTAEVVDNAHLPTEELLAQAAEKTLNGDFEGAVALGFEAKSRWERHWNGTATVADHSPMYYFLGSFLIPRPDALRQGHRNARAKSDEKSEYHIYHSSRTSDRAKRILIGAKISYNEHIRRVIEYLQQISQHYRKSVFYHIDGNIPVEYIYLFFI